MTLLQATPDISLTDVAWVIGSILVFTAAMLWWRDALALLGSARRRYARPRSAARAVFDRHGAGVMSRPMVGSAGSAARVGGSGTGSGDPVPPQQNQPELAPVRSFEDVITYLKRHKLSDDQATDLLAVAAREHDYLLSANKIRDVVGGSDAAIKTRVASHRPKPEPPRPAARIERPENGWG